MEEFKIKDITFWDARNIYFNEIKTTPDKVPILKDREFIKLYEKLSEQIAPKNILEFGIAKGGSAILHSILFNPAKYVAFDIRNSEEDILETISKLGLQNTIKLYFNISQDDREKIKNIIQEEFPSGIDLIIDDASHLFDLTLKSFEISFPYLNPYGYYIIEDWGWAHWRNFKGYKGLPALSQIAFLLIIMTFLNYTFYKDFIFGRVFFLGGHVDVVDSEKIAGWILDSSMGPSKFGIRINGKIVYEGITNVERKDIKEIYGITHKAGFHVSLQEINIEKDLEEISIEVFHIPSGAVVPGNYQKLEVKKL
ncbi:CmcI family methyltransferase [Thermocrinis sp.]